LQKILQENLAQGSAVDQAHYHLMLASDLGRDRRRIRASALLNLALLHQKAGNHGLATQFFDERHRIPFARSTEKAMVAFLYARSLFYISDYATAASLMSSALTDKELPSSWRPVFLERLGFYWGYAGNYKASLDAYSECLSLKPTMGPLGEAKIYLSTGRSRLHMQDRLGARADFEHSL
jgi:tetratricopeptide (TPR) repeat protein